MPRPIRLNAFDMHCVPGERALGELGELLETLAAPTAPPPAGPRPLAARHA